jgi:hypothetical protein
MSMPVPGLSERGHRLLHLRIQGGDGLLEVLDMAQGDADEESVVLAKAALHPLAVAVGSW